MEVTGVKCLQSQPGNPAPKSNGGMYQRFRATFAAPGTPFDNQWVTYFNWDYPAGTVPTPGNVYNASVVEDSFQNQAGWKATKLILVTGGSTPPPGGADVTPYSRVDHSAAPPDILRPPLANPEDARLASMCVAYAKDLVVAGIQEAANYQFDPQKIIDHISGMSLALYKIAQQIPTRCRIDQIPAGARTATVGVAKADCPDSCTQPAQEQPPQGQPPAALVEQQTEPIPINTGVGHESQSATAVDDDIPF